MRRRLFLLLLAVAAFAAQDVWTGVERIVALGDVHGDLEQFVTVLKSAGVINEKTDWIGGKTHLVQTGDVPDRGPDTRKVIDLLMKLEKQAARAGGRVHALIGNHEAMNIYGDLRYVTPGEFDSFRTNNSVKLRETFFERHLEDLAFDGKRPGPDYRKQWEQEHPLGWFEHRLAFRPQGDYGKWLVDHNAVIQINDALFLHGGLSPKYASQPLRKINDRVREELKDFSRLQGGIVMDPDGPLWYRGWAQGAEAELGAELEKVLGAFKVRRMVIGHTVSPTGAIMGRFDGRVIMIDVGLSKVYGGKPGWLVLENNEWFGMQESAKVPLPAAP